MSEEEVKPEVAEGGEDDQSAAAEAPASDGAAAADGDDAGAGAAAEADGDAELEEMQRKVEEMEKEASKLKEMQEEVDKKIKGDDEPAKPDDALSSFVGQLDPAVTCEELQAHFQACGTINRVTILCDKFTSISK
eukprot:g5879.t1